MRWARACSARYFAGGATAARQPYLVGLDALVEMR
jgi:hypothetical protein